MPKKRNRYEVRLNGEYYGGFKTRRAANLAAVAAGKDGGAVELIDTQPPKTEMIEGEGFVMQTDEVIDPYDSEKKLTVNRAPSQNLIETMFRRGHITIQQNQAAERYFFAKMVSSGQTNLAIDYAKVRVDTFGNGESVQISELDAKQELNEANKALTAAEIYRLDCILIDNITLRRYCLAIFRADNTRLQQQQSKALKQSLTTLAILWGYESGSLPKKGIKENAA